MRKQGATVNKDVKMLEEKLKNLKKSLVAKEGELSNLNKFINRIKGLFESRFDDCMDSLLKRQVYHSGALVRNDIAKVYAKRFKHNIIKFSKVFTPLTVQLSDGLKKAFSSHLLKQKLLTLLHKFSQVYELMMLTQILCKHEVVLLSVRCYSLGNWFPYPCAVDSIAAILVMNKTTLIE